MICSHKYQIYVMLWWYSFSFGSVIKAVKDFSKGVSIHLSVLYDTLWMWLSLEAEVMSIDCRQRMCSWE